VRGSACCYFGGSSARLSRLAPNCTHQAGVSATRLPSHAVVSSGRLRSAPLPPRPPLRKSTIHLRARRPGERSRDERAHCCNSRLHASACSSSSRDPDVRLSSPPPTFHCGNDHYRADFALRPPATVARPAAQPPAPHRECRRLDRVQCVPPPFTCDVDRRATRVLRVLIPRQIIPLLPVTWRPFVFSTLPLRTRHPLTGPSQPPSALRPLLCIATDNAPNPQRSLLPCHAHTAQPPPTLRKHHWRPISTNLPHTPWTFPRRRPEHRELIHDIAAPKTSLLLRNSSLEEQERTLPWRQRESAREPP
jgi:hypothetical protein